MYTCKNIEIYYFVTESYSIALADFKLKLPLPLSLEHWSYSLSPVQEVPAPVLVIRLRASPN